MGIWWQQCVLNVVNFTVGYMIIKNLNLSIINKYIQLIECSNSAGQGILIASAIVCIRKTVYFHEGSLLQGQFVCDTKKHSTFRIQFILYKNEKLFLFKVNVHVDTTSMLRLENTFIVSNGKNKNVS